MGEEERGGFGSFGIFDWLQDKRILFIVVIIIIIILIHWPLFIECEI